ESSGQAASHRSQQATVRRANGQTDAVVDPPGEAVPARPVPQAAQGESDQSIDRLAHRATATAAQRDIDIVTNPGAQGDVPALPEGGQVTRQVRPAEVLRQHDAVHPREANRHVTVTAEVQQYAGTETGDEVPPPKDVELVEVRAPVSQPCRQ